MRSKPPLHVHILAHPKSDVARELAASFVPSWMAAAGSQGLRVPIFLMPARDDRRPTSLDLDAAQHGLVVLLVDRHMVRRVNGEGDAWAEFARELIAEHQPGSAHHLIPVALDDKAFDLDAAINERHFLDLSKESDLEHQRTRIEFTMCVRALHLLRAGVPSDERQRTQAPITLFVSHAKRDLDEDGLDPIRFTQRALLDLPIREWFDAREIREGARFEQEIRAGIQRSDAMLVFLTDAWASRPWCRIEGLMAKEAKTPTVVVDALDEGEVRRFPYGGNARSLRWGVSLHPPEDPEDPKQRLAWESAALAQGKRVIVAAVREALRRRHTQLRLEGLAKPGDVVLDAAPEAAQLAWTAPDVTLLYPDPPLGREELTLLRTIRPQARFETPMTRFATRREGKKAALLAVSISESPDLAARGLTESHQRLLSDEVHLYLILAGLRIAYGGKLDPDKLDDPDNFTLRLFSLVRSYRGLAADIGAGALQPILNTAPWPLWKQYDDNVADAFGTIAELESLPRPDIGKSDEELGALPNGFVPPGTPLQQYAWARALTHMRQVVTDRAVARLSIGGKLEDYKGRLAGLVEEPLLSLRAHKPLYLVGALGGCTGLVIDLLEQRERPEMTTAVAREKVKGYDAIAAVYDELGGEWLTRENVATLIRQFGANGPAAALNNGLDDEENRTLFRTTDPIAIAELVLTGLERLHV